MRVVFILLMLLGSVPAFARSFDVCQAGARLEGAGYAESDAAQEGKLCELDFLNDPALVGCPKLNSTSPGIDIQKVPDGMSKDDYIKTNCPKPKERPGRKVAKFKFSMGCTYTPSVLAYYHVSRFFGSAGDIQPSVLGTVSSDVMLKFAEQAFKSLAKVLIIWDQWSQTRDAIRNPGGYGKRNRVFWDSSYDSIYGAVTKNPNHEFGYAEFNGKRKNYDDRVNAFQKTRAYHRAVSLAPIADPFSHPTLAGLQEFFETKDLTDMLVLDALLSQQDRFGNIHARKYFYFRGADQSLMRVHESDGAEIAGLGPQSTPILVKRMILKDNDCGVTKTNLAIKHRLIDSIGHLDPQTFDRLQKWVDLVQKSSTKDFFVSSLKFTEEDYGGMVRNSKHVLDVLTAKIESKKLLLDLVSSSL